MKEFPHFKEEFSDTRLTLFESLKAEEITTDKLNEFDSPITQRVIISETFARTNDELDMSLESNDWIMQEIGVRETLEPLSDGSREALKEKGYSEDVIDAIGSEEEAKIYTDADLECTDVNGKEALVRTDIDLDAKDDFGNTNLERMEKGRAPLDKNGKPIELHHIGQTADAPLAELTRSEHMSNGNDSVLHDKSKESEIDRTSFQKERAEHWKARAEDIKQNQGANNE